MAATNYGQHKSFKKAAAAAMITLTPLRTISLSVLVIMPPLLLFLHSTSIPSCHPFSTSSPSPSSTSLYSGDLRDTLLSWNHLKFTGHHPPPETLKIAVFSRKWPSGSAPGGMERHALTLHSALARRGHRVHVFSSAPDGDVTTLQGSAENSPEIHFLKGKPGQWRPEDAWPLFKAENRREPFDAVHSESVALPYRLAKAVPNLAVTWHGIALEALQSAIYQDLARAVGESMSLSFNREISERPVKVLDEIRFFHNYAHHVAISDSMGDMLRDVYQIPDRRVHVILNGVDEHQFVPDKALGESFRAEIGVPENASLVMGVAGRLVKDKGHPLLYEAFSNLTDKYPDVYLVVAGSGPWAKRYSSMGSRVLMLGALSQSKLKAFYNSIDVFLNPTLRPQGLDQTMMEAMQCGKAVVATRFPSIKGSLMVDKEFGHMFAPNVESLFGALEKVVKEGSRRFAERGRACGEYAAAMFSASKMALAYERLFLCIKNEIYCEYPMSSDY